MSVAAGIAQPSVLPPEVDHGEDDRRHGDPGDGGDDRDQGVGRPAQRADEELALELEPGDEEEQGQRAVGGPVLHVEAELGPARSGAGSRTRRRRGVGPQHGDGRGDQHDGAADRSPRAGGRRRRCSRPCRGRGGTWGGGARRSSRASFGVGERARRPDFPAHQNLQALSLTGGRGPAKSSPRDGSRGDHSYGGPTRPGLVGGQPLLDQVHHRRVGQRGHVADLAVLGDVAQQPAHDLARSGSWAARGRP